MHEEIYKDATLTFRVALNEGLDQEDAARRAFLVWERHHSNAQEQIENLELQAEENAGRASRLERERDDARYALSEEERRHNDDNYENERKITDLERQLRDAQDEADRQRAARSY